MELYDQLYRLYGEFDTTRLRAYKDLVDLFPPIDSPVALTYWQTASEELEAGQDEIRAAFPARGATFADIAAHATREQAFTALDLYTTYGREINVLVLDVDETLRSAGRTDNEIPRDTLNALTEFHDAGVPIVVCTGQTLENVKGFLIQGLGNEIVHSGSISVVYESGTGVFTPGHGSETKQLLYEDLDRDIRTIFDDVRARVLAEAPEGLRRGCHLQGNEFNVTMKPNFETGSDDARAVVDDALVYLLDLLGDAVVAAYSGEIDATELDSANPDRVASGETTEPAVDSADENAGDSNEGIDVDTGDENPADSGEGMAGGTGQRNDAETEAGIDPIAGTWARRYYAMRDAEIRLVLERRGALPGADGRPPPAVVADAFERIDVAYYEADAAEIGSLELNKVVGVQAAFDVLDITHPFTVVMGDSKSDLRVMEWVEENGYGLAAAPEHASRDVLEHVTGSDGLVFDPGRATEILDTIRVLCWLARLES